MSHWEVTHSHTPDEGIGCCIVDVVVGRICCPIIAHYDKSIIICVEDNIISIASVPHIGMAYTSDLNEGGWVQNRNCAISN